MADFKLIRQNNRLKTCSNRRNIAAYA